ncbi:BRO-B [Lymantria xylina nucleopolyhedrovirus]|uniref:BRO-B n=1 Tax=Lymantria xylina multiple nucleopolyhedrovirus TaxID=2847840 RepID=D4N266_9ABAC|nr:BRO-B [Lymantria xylina nucleopolyhedrovirus]ADD73738.1 BRO-B [Lymantria xylina nucleopolyhedrovirus]
MSQVKIGQFKFGEDAFTLRYVLERDQSVKFVAKDVATNLKYGNPANAIAKHVDDKYKSKLEQDTQNGDLASNALARQGDPLYLHPHTVLVTKEGVIQLIMKSKLPYAVELQAWLLEEVIPQVLCTGKYAPAVKMDTSGALVKIDDLTAKLTEANANLMEANKSLIVFANEMIVARRDAETARRDCEAARQDCENARRETAQLANRMADIAQDVITKPSNPRLRHTLAVCEIGQNEYAFLRPQKRNFRQSLNRLSVDDRNVVFKSEYVPNALLENLTRDQLIEAVRSSMTERQIAKVLNK